MLAGIAAMMDRMRTALMALRIDRLGATAIEYALIAGLISISIVIWAMSMGTSVTDMFTSVANGL
jgi:pilus assembly protein Flp/PilA